FVEKIYSQRAIINRHSGSAGMAPDNVILLDLRRRQLLAVERQGIHLTCPRVGLAGRIANDQLPVQRFWEYVKLRQCLHEAAIRINGSALLAGGDCDENGTFPREEVVEMEAFCSAREQLESSLILIQGQVKQILLRGECEQGTFVPHTFRLHPDFNGEKALM